MKNDGYLRNVYILNVEIWICIYIFAEVTHTPMWDTKNNLQAFEKK